MPKHLAVPVRSPNREPASKSASGDPGPQQEASELDVEAAPLSATDEAVRAGGHVRQSQGSRSNVCEYCAVKQSAISTVNDDP